MNRIRNVAIVLYDDAEELDFCGPLEIFSAASELSSIEIFNVYTVAENASPIKAHNGLSINPQYTFSNCPKSDILLVPGGYGARREMHNSAMLDWTKICSEEAELVLSVCTGSMILAKAGLLEGLTATTHHELFDLLQENAPNTTIERTKRFVDNGRIILSAGISAGIDMSFHVVERLMGREHAKKTAQYIEYDWNPE